MEEHKRPVPWRLIAAAVLLAWFGAVLVWAFQPIDDTVPTGVVNNQHTSQVVACNSPLSADAGPRESVPSLPPGRAYERAPCVSPHRQYRTLFWIDTIIVVIAMMLLVGVRRRGAPVRERDAAHVPVAVG